LVNSAKRSPAYHVAVTISYQYGQRLLLPKIFLMRLSSSSKSCISVSDQHRIINDNDWLIIWYHTWFLAIMFYTELQYILYLVGNNAK
jgi:hypothetical protein